MTKQKEINRLTTEFLDLILDINTKIGDRSGIVKKDDFEQDERQLYCELVTKADKKFLRVRNWHSHSICLSGLVFTEDLLLEGDRSPVVASFPARLQDGVGERFLYSAIGSREVRVELNVETPLFSHVPKWGNDYLDAWLGIALVQFFTEDEADLDAMLVRLKEQMERFEKFLNISMVADKYKSFHKLTGLKTEEFYKDIVPNKNYEQFFDEE